MYYLEVAFSTYSGTVSVSGTLVLAFKVLEQARD